MPNWLMTIISVVSSTSWMLADLADLGGGAHVDDALAAAGLQAVHVDVGALAEAVFGDGEDEAGGEAELFVELGELGDGFFGERGGGDGVAGLGEFEGAGRLAASVVSSRTASTCEVRPAAAARARRSLVAGLGGGGDGGADDVVALLERDALVAVGGAAHGAEVLLVEADGHAVVGGEEDDLLAVGDAGGDELVVLVDADGDDAAGHDVGEVLERGLLDGAVAGGEEDVTCRLLRGRGRGGW